MEKVYLKIDPHSIDTYADPIRKDYIEKFHNWKDLSKGKDLTVAVVDTGVDDSHPIFQGVEVEHHDLTGRNNSSRDGIGHGCITPESRVYTSQCGLQTIQETYERSTGMKYELPDGTNIKDVTRQDIYTLSLDQETGEMNRRKVEAVHKIPYEGKLHCVKTKSGTIKLTPWHPVYVRTSSRGQEETIIKKRADEVEEGDMICLARTTDQGVADSYLEIPYTSDGDSISLNEELGFLAGLVISDGYIDGRRNNIKFSNVNKDLINEFCRLVEELFDKTPSIVTRKDQANYMEASFTSSEAVTVLSNIGLPKGAKSLTAWLPELISKSPLNVIWSFFAGLIEGDGSVNEEGRLRIITGSQQLAEDLVTLLNTLGVKATWFNHSQGGPNSLINSEHSYCVRLSSIEDITSRLVTKGTNFTTGTQANKASRVEQIWLEDYNDYLYDFTVEEDHNYVADGHIVSNTACAGLIVQHCPFVKKIIDLRIFGGEGRTSGSILLSAYDFLLENADRIDLANFSIGTNSKSRPIDSRHQQVIKKGVRTVSASGNSGVDSGGSPASAEGSVAVGALTRNGELTDFSSSDKDYGTPSLCALGQNIAMPRASGTSMGSPIDEEWTMASGTSFSCPITLAAIANYMAQYNKFVREDFLQTAEDIPETGRDGAGILNVGEALQSGSGDDDKQDDSKVTENTMYVGRYGEDRSLIWLRSTFPEGTHKVRVSQNRIEVIE